MYRFAFPLFLWLVGAAHADETRLRALILDGRNNHDWRATTTALRNILLQTGRFDVEVSTAPVSYRTVKLPPARPPKAAGEQAQANYTKLDAEWKQRQRDYETKLQPAWDAWRPGFSEFDVVINNYNGTRWPTEVEQAFVAYLEAGGGLVNVHAANNAFADWEAFNQIIGLGWRKEAQGKRLYVDAQGVLQEEPPGTGGNSSHGSKHPFPITVRSPEHPIMRGLPKTWLHGEDELYHAMRGPAEHTTILSTAWSDEKQRGSGRHEPMTWATRFGQGRSVTTSMGHYWWTGSQGARTRHSLHCVGFQTVFARAAEWAGSGTVSLDVPAPFPGPEQISIVHPERVAWSVNGRPSGPSRLPVAERWKRKKQLNPYAMLSPEEAAAAAVLPPGYRMELVLSEPVIQDPVLAAWDGNGRLYVAEMRSYMQDEYGNGTKTLKNGRISRHEDTDGDGRMDRHTVFVDGLNLPRMILPLDDRIAIVETDSLDIHSYRDTDGDGVADEKKLLIKGFRTPSPTRSVEHQQAGLFWSIDNWIYLSRGEARYRFTNGDMVMEKMMGDWNQWGLDQDDTGRLFYSDNSHPGERFQQHPIYWEMSKARAKGRWRMPTLGSDYAPAFMRMYSTCTQGDRGEDHAYQGFTSATGHCIFRGDALPEALYGNFFVCDPTGHLVRRATVTDRRGHLQLENPYQAAEGEFIVSSDINFRPVSTATGPDGCLYVVDMYRGMIQDEPWVNEGMKRFLRNTGLNLNIEHGRIWRVVHEKYQPTARPTLLDEDTENLADYLSYPNGWTRDTAQRLMVLRKDRDRLIPRLRDMLRSEANPLARLHALWTLDGMDAVTAEEIKTALGDADPRVRAAGLRNAERFLKANQGAVNWVAPLASDPDPAVRRQLVLSLGYTHAAQEAEALQVIERALRSDLGDAGLYLAGMTTLYGQKTPLIEDMLKGAAFKAIEDPAERAAARARWLGGIQGWDSDQPVNTTLDPETLALITRGEEIYGQTCVTCHGEDGRGVTPPGVDISLAPPLAGSTRVLGPKERLLRILQHGLIGPVDGKHYEAGIMVPGAALGLNSDRDFAAISSFIRQQWGNQAEPILPAQAEQVRADAVERSAPWTLEELADFALPLLPDRSGWQVDCGSGPENARLAIAEDRRSCDQPNRPGSWFRVDLGKAHRLTELVLDANHPDRYPRGVVIRSSMDGKTWSEPIARQPGRQSLTRVSFAPVVARYVKIEQTGESKHHRWSIAELYLHGRPSP